MIQWGIIGCGDVTEVKSGPAFNLVANSRLVAVMRRDAAKAADYARRHGVPKWYANAEELLRDEEVNAVYVATPPASHAEYAMAAMRAGKPVYVEKPMARTFAECQQMLQVAEETGVPLYVAYYRRALPGFLKVKEWVESGRLGKIRQVHMKLYKSLNQQVQEGATPWRVQPELAGGGHFYDLAAHQLDYVDFLFGPIEEVQGMAVNQAGLYDAEDAVAASFVLPGNILLSASWNFNVPAFLEEDLIEIIGEKGKVSFSCFDFVPVKLITADGVEEADFPKPRHVQQDLIQQVVAALLQQGESPSTGESGARTNAILEQVVDQYYKKNYDER